MTPTIDSIIRAVAEYHHIKPAHILSPCRFREYAWPRQEAYWLARELTGRSLPEIGRAFGGRDHTTIIFGIRAVEARTTEQEREDLLALGEVATLICAGAFRSRRLPVGAVFKSRRDETNINREAA